MNHELESVYGHKQVFVPEKLKAVGQWCIDRLGEGSMSIEDCVGGLLVVNRKLIIVSLLLLVVIVDGFRLLIR